MQELWVEKYRPNTVDDYVWRDEKQKNQVKSWIAEKAIPHLLLSGTQGIGKTSLAELLFKQLGAPKADILTINASDDNSVEVIRNRVSHFVGQMSFGGGFRYILLDEADYLTPNAQAVLRGLIEKSTQFARFILTCNYPERIIPALHSRCQGFHLTQLDQTEFETRIATILLKEGVAFDIDLLDTYVKATYPDLRKCINSIQQNTSITLNQKGTSNTKQLDHPNSKDASSEIDWQIEMVELFKKGKITQARKLVCGKARNEEIQGVFTFLYQNLELWGDAEQQEQAILIIRDAVYKSSFVADQEINLAACLVQLRKIVNGE